MAGSGFRPSTPALDELSKDLGRSLLSELQLLSRQHKGAPSLSVLRVAQLDAGRLDAELSDMLRESLSKAFAFFRPGLLSALQPELTLMLDLLIFSCSVWVGKPTPGANLMNLRFRNEHAVGRGAASGGPRQQQQTSSAPAANSSHVGGFLVDGRTGVEGPGLSRAQRVSYGLTILLRYTWARASSLVALRHWVQDREAPDSWGSRAWRILQRTEAAARVAALINTLVFLRHGVYRSINERLLGARLVFQRANMARALSFEYLNRQLVWQELSELLLFLLPLVNVTQMRRRLLDHLPRMRGSEPGHLGSLSRQGGAERQTCGICSADTMLDPYEAQPCGHSFCYYCLRSRTEADMQYKCPLCLIRISAMRRAVPSRQ